METRSDRKKSRSESRERRKKDSSSYHRRKHDRSRTSEYASRRRRPISSSPETSKRQPAQRRQSSPRHRSRSPAKAGSRSPIVKSAAKKRSVSQTRSDSPDSSSADDASMRERRQSPPSLSRSREYAAVAPEDRTAKLSSSHSSHIGHKGIAMPPERNIVLTNDSANVEVEEIHVETEETTGWVQFK